MANNIGLFGDGQNKSSLFGDGKETSTVFSDTPIEYHEQLPIEQPVRKRGRPIKHNKKPKQKVRPEVRRGYYVSDKRKLHKPFVDDAESIVRKILGILNIKYEYETGIGTQKVKAMLFDWICMKSKT